MLKTSEKQIGDSAYRVSQLKATKSLSLFIELARMLGPAFGIVADAVGGKDGKIDITKIGNLKLGGDTFSRIVNALVERIDNPKVQTIVKELAQVTEVAADGAADYVNLPAVYELHFAAKVDELFKWLAFALEVQYGGFFSSLGALGRPGSKTPAPAPRAG